MVVVPSLGPSAASADADVGVADAGGTAIRRGIVSAGDDGVTSQLCARSGYQRAGRRIRRDGMGTTTTAIRKYRRNGAVTSPNGPSLRAECDGAYPATTTVSASIGAHHGDADTTNAAPANTQFIVSDDGFERLLPVVAVAAVSTATDDGAVACYVSVR